MGCLLKVRFKIIKYCMQASRQDDISTYISCFLCQQPCIQPRLCPKCSKVFCERCLLSACTLIRPQCPSCCVRLRMQEFLSTEVVTGIVDQIKQRFKKQERRGEQRQQCVQHEMPLSYFCVECNLPLCSDCGMLTSKHVGHKFVSYRDIYERIKRRVLDEFPRFDRKIGLLQERKGWLRTRLGKLQDEYKRFKKYFEETWLSYSQRIESSAKARQAAVVAKQQISSRRLQELQILRDSIYQQMETKTHISLIRQTNSLAQSISALSCQEPPLLTSERVVEVDDMIELVPEYVSWRYTLTQFSARSGIVYSQGRCVNGVDWRLKVYPKGNGLARQKFLSVFVQMSKGFTGQNKYEYRIQLINLNHPELTVRREYCSTFEIGQCWGYNQFEPLEHLAVKEYLNNDELVFQVGIRNRTYRALVNEQMQYILNLTKQIAEKEKNESDGVMRRQRIKEGRSGGKGEGRLLDSSEKGQEKQQMGFESSTLQRIKDYLLKESKEG